MTSLKEQYVELLALTKSYILQEHALSERIFDSPETFEYFRNAAKQQTTASQKAESSQPKIGGAQSNPISAPTPKPVLPQRSMNQYPLKPQTPAAINPPLENKIAPKPVEKAVVIPSDTAKRNAASTVPATPSPQNNAPANGSKESSAFKIEAPPPAKPVEISDFRKIITERLPHVAIMDHIPDDAEARRVAMSWTISVEVPQVIILSHQESPAHSVFLTNVAKALQIYGYTVEIRNGASIEQEKGWDALIQSSTLRLIIAGSNTLYTLPELKKHHREVQKLARHYLGERPLLMLSDIGFYLKEPTLKISLWHALKELLAIPAKAT